MRARLCLVFPHLALGGGETVMIAVAEGLRAGFDLDGFDLDVWALDDGIPGPGRTLPEELARRCGGVALARRR